MHGNLESSDLESRDLESSDLESSDLEIRDLESPDLVVVSFALFFVQLSRLFASLGNTF